MRSVSLLVVLAATGTCTTDGAPAGNPEIEQVSQALTVPAVGPAFGPAFVDITWMSITNVYYQLGALKILTDGYFTRIPATEFFGGGGGLAHTRHAFKPDVPLVTRVRDALGGATAVNVLLTGHSHFDHSFELGFLRI